MIISTKKAVQILTKSGIVAIPTETVYGLAGLANDQNAVNKIYKAKNRPADNPLICHFYDLKQIQKYVSKISKYAEVLIDELCPGPVSFLFELNSTSELKPSTARLNSIICRIPKHPIALEILELVNVPLAAPSANTSGKFSGTNAQMIEADFGDKIDGVVDGGNSNIGLESSIIDCRKEDQIIILRPGFIGKKEIQEVLNKHGINLKIIDFEKKPSQQATPGAKYQHYAPKTPVFELRPEVKPEPKSAILGSQKALEKLKQEMIKNNSLEDFHYLELGKNSTQIAHNLYQKMFELDQLNLKKAYLIKENYGTSSQAKAIRNRLEKVLRG
jgi:L-threonylcarbamoyladenylate synthase